MKNDAKTNYVMDKFVGWVIRYVEDYFASLNGKIYRPNIDYCIPHEDYVTEHWKELCEELRTLKPVFEYSVSLKKMIKLYLLLFFRDYPELKEEKCLKLS